MALLVCAPTEPHTHVAPSCTDGPHGQIEADGPREGLAGHHIQHNLVRAPHGDLVVGQAVVGDAVTASFPPMHFEPTCTCAVPRKAMIEWSGVLRQCNEERGVEGQWCLAAAGQLPLPQPLTPGMLKKSWSPPTAS